MSTTAPLSLSPHRTRLAVVLGVLVVVGVGAFVGRRAGDLAHRAPRGSGVRFAVLQPASAETTATWARALQDAIVKNVAEVPGASLVSPLVVDAKVAAMKRGGVDDATPADAAKVLDVGAIVSGALHGDQLTVHVVDDRGNERANVGVSLSVPPTLGPAVDAAVGAVWQGLAPDAARPPLKLPTSSLEAYGAYLDGQRAVERDGRLREGAASLRAAVAADAGFGEAWAALAYALWVLDDPSDAEDADARMATQQARAHAATISARTSLVLDVIERWEDHDAANPELRQALREPAIAACRALTVRFPEDRTGHYLLGRAYDRLFDAPEEALRHLEAARRLTPQYFPITQELVVAWMKRGDRKHAEQELRGFLVNVPNHAEAQALLDGLAVPDKFRP